MKAQTLSICMPGTACDKKCPYCVSKMTWAPQKDEEAWIHNMPKVVHFARMAQVTDVIITGKGEPTLSEHFTLAIESFSQWPVVLQTNGKSLSKELPRLKRLAGFGLNVISVSIDDPAQMSEYKGLWDGVKETSPLTSRATVMLTPEVCAVPFTEWVAMCKFYGIRGLSFREITIPKDYVHTKQGAEVARWIQGLDGNKTIVEWKKDFDQIFLSSPRTPRTIRRLPYGAVIKDFDGISVTKFEYCIQDSTSEDDIRSLVYNQDGHLYTTWSSPASLVF